ncbi:MAG: hypothetical protein ACYDD1_11805 [Caulobacteraceae bacterium]
MDKTAQAARQARLAQALRTNLRRRKSADAPKGVEHGDDAPADEADARDLQASDADLAG